MMRCYYDRQGSSDKSIRRTLPPLLKGVAPQRRRDKDATICPSESLSPQVRHKPRKRHPLSHYPINSRIHQTICHCERSVAKCGNLGGVGLVTETVPRRYRSSQRQHCLVSSCLIVPDWLHVHLLQFNFPQTKNREPRPSVFTF